MKATFFLVGSHAQAEPELVRRIVAAGHLIGNHSWRHPNLALTAASFVRQELKSTSDALEQIAGVRVKYFRPPFGARRPAVFRAAREQGLTPVLWNAMTTDWKLPSADAIAERLTVESTNWSGVATQRTLCCIDGNHRDRSGDRGPSVGAAEKLIELTIKTRIAL